MSIFVKPTEPPKPRSEATTQVSLLFAILLVIMAVAQLFTFDTFIPYIQTLHLPLSMTASYVVAPVLVISEVFAIPFLLRMWLSPAFRALSMFLGWVAAFLWLFLSSWVVLSGHSVDSIGFLGTVVKLIPGWWAIFYSVALGILAAWSSWGLWPGKRSAE